MAGDHTSDPAEPPADPATSPAADPAADPAAEAAPVPARVPATEQATTTPRRSVRKLRSQLLVDPAAWPHDAASFALLLTATDLPIPFDLRPGVKVVDATRFLAQLRRDIALGLGGPRARFGALQGDLVRLHNIVLTAAGVAICPR